MELAESEHVVPRGAKRTTWWVLHDGRWLSVTQLTGAAVSNLSCGRGTVWNRSVRLTLAVGTIIARVITEPVSEPARSPLEHLLMTPSKPRTRRSRSAYRLEAGGKLTRLPAVQGS